MSRIHLMTNECGERATLADTISPVNMNAVASPDREIRKKMSKTGELYNVSQEFKFGILANYLMHTYNFGLRKGVKYGCDGRVNWIEVDGRTYWERRGIIHDRFRSKK